MKIQIAFKGQTHKSLKMKLAKGLEKKVAPSASLTTSTGGLPSGIPLC